jgi:hypothetical protein
VTGGLCQVGWAIPTTNFQPQSDEGDGVGDDVYSYAYDGSRGIVLHNSESTPYGPQQVDSSSSTTTTTTTWQAEDVVGCLWDCAQSTLSFSLNGTDLGVAFALEPPKNHDNSDSDTIILFPAISANANEIVQVHLHSSDMMYAPPNVCPLGDVMMTTTGTTTTTDSGMMFALSATSTTTTTTLDPKPPAVSAVMDTPKANEDRAKSTSTTQVVVEPLDLDKYETVQQLEALGLDRLKGALMAMGVKCGGTLTQRAERLWSLKGLEPKDYPPKLLAKKSKHLIS